jgi:Major capsid protein N-terminus/Large eukaryotic DNA virus major capsid protein
MSGGVVQLVATGAQDEWLTGKPEVSFYRSNYKRHTHYSASAERQIIQGTPIAGGISTIRFEKKGDLMNYVYFIGKDSTGSTVPGVDWSKVIDKIELLIGGQVVDTQDMVWMTQVEPVPGAQNYSTRYLNTNPTGLTNVINGFLPLKFFFCKDWSSSLPLVALQFHDVELRITWSNNLNYRVNYEFYSVAAPSTTNVPNLATTTAVSNPITGSAVATNAGAMSLTINNGSLSQTTSYQSNPFTYSGANFQLVPGMALYGSSGTPTLAGATTLVVISVNAGSSTSGTFYGAFFGSQATPTSGSLSAVTAYVHSTPYPVTTVTPQAIGAPFIITTASVDGTGSAASHVYTVTASTGYPSVGMTATNIPGTSAGSVGYISSIAYNAGGDVNTVTVTFVVASVAAAITSASPAGFSAQPASVSAAITPVLDPRGNTPTGTLTYTTPTYSAGTLQYASAPASASGLILGVYVATITQTGTSGLGTITITVTAAGTTISTTVTGTGFTSASNLLYSYAPSARTISYTVGATAVVAGTIYPGQSIPATSMPPGTSGTGYVGVVTAGATYVTSFQVLYAADQLVTTSAAVNVTLYAPGPATFSSSTAAVSTKLTVYSTTTVPSGYLVPGMSVSGLSATTGTGYIYQINASNTPAAPGAQTTSVSVWYPTAPTTTTAATAVPALPPIGTVQSSVVGQTVYTNVPIYGLGVGALALPVNSIITTNYPASLGATVFIVSAIAYQSPGVALATLTLYANPVNGVAQTPTITVAPILSISTALPVFTPSYPILNLLVAAPTGTPVVGSSILGFASGQAVNLPIATINTIYGSVTGGYLVSMNTNQQLVGGVVPATINTFITGAGLSFVPPTYYAGVITSSFGSFTTTGGTTGSLTIGQATQSASPRLSTYFYTTNSTTGQTTALSNAVVISSADSTHLAVQYTASTSGTGFSTNTQFALIPQAQLVGQLSSSQPVVDRSGSAIISLAYLSGTVNVAIGQAVIGTQYTGPVTVSQVVASSGTTTGSAGSTATIEISFPVQSQPPSLTTGASTFIQFIDPSQTLNSGVTVSGGSYTTTYQNLQYEAWCNFVYLDQKERDYFSKTVQDMLITQVQRISIQNTTYQEISIAQPVKYIAFLSNNYSTAYQQSQTSGYPAAASYYLKTQINGVDVGDSRSMLQWQDVTQYYHTPYGYNNMGYVAPVALIPYCIDTSKLQPTGTLNFSRLDTYRVVAPVGSSLLQLSGGAAYFYAVNYNILRIQNGLGGLLYAN